MKGSPNGTAKLGRTLRPFKDCSDGYSENKQLN